MTFTKISTLICGLFLAGCIQSKAPIFLPSDGDNIGTELLSLESALNGKPLMMNVRRTNSETYKITYASDQTVRTKEAIYRAIKRTNDGILYAAQVLEERPTVSAGEDKQAYIVYPVKIDWKGNLQDLEFNLNQDEFIALGKKFNVSFAMLNPTITGRFNRQNAQCLVNFLVENEMFKIKNVNEVDRRLSGYVEPKNIKLIDCR